MGHLNWGHHSETRLLSFVSLFLLAGFDRILFDYFKNVRRAEKLFVSEVEASLSTLTATDWMRPADWCRKVERNGNRPTDRVEMWHQARGLMAVQVHVGPVWPVSTSSVNQIVLQPVGNAKHQKEKPLDIHSASPLPLCQSPWCYIQYSCRSWVSYRVWYSDIWWEHVYKLRDTLFIDAFISSVAHNCHHSQQQFLVCLRTHAFLALLLQQTHRQQEKQERPDKGVSRQGHLY